MEVTSANGARNLSLLDGFILRSWGFVVFFSMEYPFSVGKKGVEGLYIQSGIDIPISSLGQNRDGIWAFEESSAKF